MEGHTKVLGVLWIIYGVLGILMGLLILGLLFGISYLPKDHESPLILRTVAVAGGGLIALLSLPEVIAGFALLKFKEWGRILALIVAVLNVIWFPFGTALSIYTFVILLNTETIALFQKN
ncbi:MAG: hypothetical protein JSV17_11390 [Candidatus Aminicenantes bacterium]|nr:MAG: hypothetical protein JSV17_11390 [Candidatus Aminicenantes bacterium]